ncbi:MAG: HDIG domain-containing protein [Armatimonadetes bacterium]|nr:HDIG domain-containing protein [Armatimonadota bacterium]
MSVNLLPDRVALRLGEVSPRDIRAPRTVVYIDSVATGRLQQAARLDTRPVYETDSDAQSASLATVQEAFGSLAPMRTAAGPRARGKPLPASLAFLGAGAVSHLLSMPSSDFAHLRAVTQRVVQHAMNGDIRQGTHDLQDADTVAAASAAQALPPADAAIASRIAARAIRPERTIDPERTEQARDAAERAVPMQYHRIARGDKIISSGDTVTQETLDKFAAVGLLNPRLDVTTGAMVCLLAAFMVLLVLVVVARTLPALYRDTRRLALLAVIALLSVLGLKVGASMLGLSFSSGQLGYLGMMSVAAAGMLVAALLDVQLAVLVAALLSVQSGLIMNHEIRFTIMTLMSSLVGIFSVSLARTRSGLLLVTAALAGTNLALVWLLGILLRDSLPELLTGSAWAVGSAAFATFMFWIGALVLERPFGILTPATLLDLSSIDQPLLRELCAVAPGTYAHSMLVGTLADAGAQTIGANALLCRVSGFYHDIGKMRRPEFFIENQQHENVHGRLSASLSALIITAHVRDGLEMAAANRLPREIRDAIAQHHGTTLIRYFYHRALTDCGGTDEAPPGLEERFRYPGPKPQTRESAIVMLADSVEAAARCLQKPNPERLEALIAGIVREKIEDGQFDDCSITFRDVKAVSDAFLHVLAAMMHHRIDYPDPLPRGASGMPMEVVRADLKPEPPELELPMAAGGLAHSGELPYPDDDPPANRPANAEAAEPHHLYAHSDYQQESVSHSGSRSAARRRVRAARGAPTGDGGIERRVDE